MMSALQTIERELRGVGYAADAIVRDYVFADVLAETPLARTAHLAAFTHTPRPTARPPLV
jgi:hypothetical protein